MGVEIQYRLDTEESRQFNRLISERYEIHKPDLDDYLRRIRYVDHKTGDIVLENAWDYGRMLDRWVVLDPAVELFLLANTAPEAMIVRTP